MNIDGPLFLGRLSEALSNLIEEQTAEVFAANGLLLPVKSPSLLVELERAGPASAADLAQALGCSHQLVLQKTPKLIKIGVIVRAPCTQDGRRKLFSLTAKGREQLKILRSLEPKFVGAYEELGGGSGELYRMLGEAIDALKHRSLIERMTDGDQ